MIRQPVVAKAGLSPGSSVLAYSDEDGQLVLRRAEDAMKQLLEEGAP